MGISPTRFNLVLLLLVACGGNAEETTPAPVESSSTGASQESDAESDEGVDAVLIGCVGSGCEVLVGALRNHPPIPPPLDQPAEVLPERRIAATAATTRPAGLAAAAAVYAELDTQPIGSSVAAATLTDAVGQLRDQAAAASVLLARLSTACDLAAIQDTALAPEAETLKADGYDLLAGRLTNAPFVVPTDLEERVQLLPPEDQASLRVEVLARVRDVLTVRAAPLFCEAARAYRSAGTPRASEQLGAYGNALLLHCGL